LGAPHYTRHDTLSIVLRDREMGAQLLFDKTRIEIEIEMK